MLLLCLIFTNVYYPRTVYMRTASNLNPITKIKCLNAVGTNKIIFIHTNYIDDKIN